jgi:hypothetical protein
MTDEKRSQLIALLDEFISGRQRTLPQADRIAEFILTNYLDTEMYDDFFEEPIGYLGQYSPFKEEPHLFGDDDLVPELRYLRERLMSLDI